MLNTTQDGKILRHSLILINKMETTEIYIIKVISYRESSNLYEAIAKGYGKITLIHKGIRSNVKKNALELFIPKNRSRTIITNSIGV